MGNVHEVIQTDPWRSPRGAAIEIRRGAEDAIGPPFPSYVDTARGRRAIGASRVATPRTFVCIHTGGKRGYDDELAAWLHARARHLHDACFYVQDEYTEYVEEWRIAGGACTVRCVEPKDSHVGLHLAAARPELMPFAVELLADHLAGTWFFSAPDDDSARARALAVLTAHAPERWDTWHELGRMYADAGKHADAVPALERACALAPPEHRPRAEARLLDALAEIDRPRALALGRAGRASWLAAAERADPFDNQAARGLEVLAGLEPDGDAAARLAMDALRTASDRDLARRLYNIACLRTAERRIPEAVDWLRAAVLLDPGLATAAVDDADFVALPRPDLVRIFELARDLDG